MIYKQLCGEKVSMMGMGMMRLPVIDGVEEDIDEAAAIEMIDCAYKAGINYFDTAWGYHGGNSELVAGKALANYPRESFNLADKFPGYDTSNFGKVEEIFEQQLEKCGIDYFDFYLAHNVCEINIESYLDDEQFHTLSYLKDQREQGRIKHLGLSVHGTFETFMRFMEAYGDDMEFCQIELNYLDWEFQDAKAKVSHCVEHNIPVIVMEPLRGGYLVNLKDEYAAKLQDANAAMSQVEWAFRWLQGIEGVSVVLSGSSSLEQMQQNIDIFAKAAPLTDSENAVLAQIAAAMSHEKGLPCTACHYCVSHCPVGLDIPYLISLYNEHLSKEEGGFIAPMALAALPPEKQPGACIACNSCHDVCPQALEISEFLAEFAQAVAS